MTGTALLAALEGLETVLQEEALSPLGEGLTARKEAAVALLQVRLSGGVAEQTEVDALAERLRKVMVANRYSLKWTSLRAHLAQLGQPKPAAEPTRPRLDLVH